MLPSDVFPELLFAALEELMTVYGQHLTFCVLAGMFPHLLLLLETHMTFQLSAAQSGSCPSLLSALGLSGD